VIQALTFAAFTVTLDGKTVEPRARAAVVGDHVLLPVRALGAALGAGVAYDGRAHAIVVRRGTHLATISSRGAVRTVNGRAYAPLRAVATAFGLSVAYDGPTRTISLGDRGGAVQPLRGTISGTVAGPAPGATYSPVYSVTLRPGAGAEVHEPYPAISVRFAGAISVDPRSLHVLLDGRDVTPDAAVIGDQVLLTPRTALAPGSHAVSVVARDANGAPLAQQWSFVDSFTFVAAPAPTPFPVAAIWVDRWIAPGTNAFNVYVEGVPGITGYVGIDGVAGFFPLQVYSANGYVAHVFIPNGVNQPFARVAARLTLPNGEPQFIVLPQRINLVTAPLNVPPPATPTPVPRPIVAPTRRSVDVPSPPPTPTPTAAPRRLPVFTRTPLPAPTPLATPAIVPAARATPTPAATPAASPKPQPTRRPIIRRTPKPTPQPE
jgi:hypothetical protein